MTLLDRKGLGTALRAIDAVLEEPADLILVGGAAVLLLTDGVRVTFDLDAMQSAGLERIARATAESPSLPLNARSDPFEVFLPEDWRERLIGHTVEGVHRLRVYTPSPEDLAIMKVFRFGPKDADDIARLAGRRGFDRRSFRQRFIRVLRAAIGDPGWHAHSFEMVWNRLFPAEPLRREDLLSPLAGGEEDR